MADDNSVEIKFSASTDEAVTGIEQVHEYLSDLAEPLTGLTSSAEQLGKAFSAGLPLDLLANLKSGVDDAGAAVRNATSQAQGLGTQLKLVQDYFAQQKIPLDEEVKQFQITQDRKFTILKQENEQELAAEVALVKAKIELRQSEGKGAGDLNDKIAALNAKSNIDGLRLDDQAMTERKAMWNSYLSTVTSAFNSQLRGLLEGTTNWHQATIKMFEDLTIKFI
jgi:hypothetical protein